MGQAGVAGGATHVATPTLVAGLTGVEQLESSYEFNCALTDGEVWCWGTDLLGQLGSGTRGTTTPNPAPTRVGTIDDAVEIVVGIEHGCARRAGGEVWCWGDNLKGALASLIGRTHAPTPLPDPAAAERVVAGGHNTLIREDGAWYGMGTNTAHQVPGGGSQSLIYQRLDVLDGSLAVDIAQFHSCWLDAEAILHCSSSILDVGRTGHGSFEGNERLEPIHTALGVIRYLDVGRDHTCVVTSEDRLWCFGAAVPATGTTGDPVFTPVEVSLP
jgi:alpha-tubulin suppressor-like RCC1 family protein